MLACFCVGSFFIDPDMFDIDKSAGDGDSEKPGVQARSNLPTANMVKCLPSLALTECLHALLMMQACLAATPMIHSSH